VNTNGVGARVGQCVGPQRCRIQIGGRRSVGSKSRSAPSNTRRKPPWVPLFVGTGNPCAVGLVGNPHLVASRGSRADNIKPLAIAKAMSDFFIFIICSSMIFACLMLQ